ncbi:uncharacterized protein LOC133805860 [Humulus lupulus]|uniref:uncharacterized protein LOC133805860 n=1 Tax=Humulus lupulus TaxID=3486 RepID=UPI002B415A3D|nr:uncharacterized protein LOC133805860 [Humulus lupulus]
MEQELGHELIEYDRSEMWTRAQMNKKGEVIDEEAREVVKRIAEYMQKVAEGELVVEGSNDILTMTLDTPEQGGRSSAFGSSNASGSGEGGASNTPHTPYDPPPPTQAPYAPPPPTWTSYAQRPPSQIPYAPPPPT